MKLLMIGPTQSAQLGSAAGAARQALQAAQVERYVVYQPKPGESKLAAAWRMWLQSKHEDFDTVTAQDPFFIGHIAWHIARARGARLNLQVHTDLSGPSPLMREWARFHLRRADSVRVVSHKIKKQVEAMGVQAPIAVLPLFVDLSKFIALTPQPHSQKTVLWIGRFEKEKDPLKALEVFKEVHAQIDAKLVMLGSGSLEKTLRERAGGLPIVFPGWQDPAPYLAQADVVLSTSPQESYGASIIEALAARVPVVAPDVGVAKEAGAKVVPRSELAAAVIEVLKSGERGELKLLLPTAEKWAEEWQKTL